MSCPTTSNMQALKRLGRYLIQYPRAVSKFEYQRYTRNLNVWSDSDFAGCSTTRKSTSGAVIRLGTHVVKHTSHTQSVISLSSGEAEYYAMVRACGMGMGIQSILEDWNLSTSLTLKTDASAAVGIALRKGLGKVRHIEVSQLWLQEKVSEGKVKIEKVDGCVNISDHLTKHLDAKKLGNDCASMHLTRSRDRHPLTPQV